MGTEGFTHCREYFAPCVDLPVQISNFLFLVSENCSVLKLWEKLGFGVGFFGGLGSISWFFFLNTDFFKIELGKGFKTQELVGRYYCVYKPH